MIRLIKCVIWFVALLPLGWNLWLGLHDQLGADPGKALVDNLGLWALRILLLTLLLRPLRETTGISAFIQVRRLVGLFAWFYATLHFAAAILYVVGWSAPELLKAVSEKTYILLGFIAWLLMLPLGVTSNRWAQRRLKERWRRLHRLIYPLAIFACLHFIWLVRSDYWQPALYTSILAILLLWRIPAIRRMRNELVSRVSD